MFGKIREDIEKFSEYGVSIDAEMLHEQIDTQLKQLKGNKALAQQMHECYSIPIRIVWKFFGSNAGMKTILPIKKGIKPNILRLIKNIQISILLQKGIKFHAG